MQGIPPKASLRDRTHFDHSSTADCLLCQGTKLVWKVITSRKAEAEPVTEKPLYGQGRKSSKNYRRKNEGYFWTLHGFFVKMAKFMAQSYSLSQRSLLERFKVP